MNRASRVSLLAGLLHAGVASFSDFLNHRGEHFLGLLEIRQATAQLLRRHHGQFFRLKLALLARVGNQLEAAPVGIEPVAPTDQLLKLQAGGKYLFRPDFSKVTSGVILTARTKPAAAFLGKAMMGRKVQKTYLAIVAPGAPSISAFSPGRGSAKLTLAAPGSNGSRRRGPW